MTSFCGFCIGGGKAERQDAEDAKAATMRWVRSAGIAWDGAPWCAAERGTKARRHGVRTRLGGSECGCACAVLDASLPSPPLRASMPSCLSGCIASPSVRLAR